MQTKKPHKRVDGAEKEKKQRNGEECKYKEKKYIKCLLIFIKAI